MRYSGAKTFLEWIIPWRLGGYKINFIVESFEFVNNAMISNVLETIYINLTYSHFFYNRLKCERIHLVRHASLHPI